MSTGGGSKYPRHVDNCGLPDTRKVRAQVCGYAYEQAKVTHPQGGALHVGALRPDAVAVRVVAAHAGVLHEHGLGAVQRRADPALPRGHTHGTSASLPSQTAVGAHVVSSSRV